MAAFPVLFVPIALLDSFSIWLSCRFQDSLISPELREGADGNLADERLVARFGYCQGIIPGFGLCNPLEIHVKNISAVLVGKRLSARNRFPAFAIPCQPHVGPRDRRKVRSVVQTREQIGPG